MIPDRLRDDVRQALSDPYLVCERLGLMEGSKRQAAGLSIRCPAHDEKEASCSVTRGPDGTLRVRCFACNFSADIFGLVGQVRGIDARREFKRVLVEAAALAGIDASRVPSAPAPRPELRSVPPPTPAPAAADLTTTWDSLPDVDADAWEYLRGRGLDAAADLCRSVPAGEADELEQLAAGGWSLAQALRDAAGRVVAIQVRKLGGRAAGEKDQRFRAFGPTTAGVFGEPQKIARARVVVLCEGWSDTLVAVAAVRANLGYSAIGVAGVKALQALGGLPLAGKIVLLATDADVAGDECARQASAQLTAIGARPIRARPPSGKDLTELAGSRDLADFFQTTATGFRSVAAAVRDERGERVAMRGRHLEFGIRFLDLAFGGIFPSDLILIGAQTGRGKTQAATIIARHNAEQGKRAHILALEADRLEIERRLKYPAISNLLWGETPRNVALCNRLNFVDWYKGDLDDELAPYEAQAERFVTERYASLFVRYKDRRRFDAQTLEQSILDVADETDLVVVDHLHYIDGDPKATENRALKEVVQTVRDVQRRIEKPVILVAHVRKADRSHKTLIPTLDDFHGSSDVSKIATKAVMIAPAWAERSSVPYLSMTYIEPAKFRVEGSRTRYVAMVAFNFRTGRYQPAFALGKLNEAREKWEPVPEREIPEWAIERPPPTSAPAGAPPPPEAGDPGVSA